MYVCGASLAGPALLTSSALKNWKTLLCSSTWTPSSRFSMRLTLPPVFCQGIHRYTCAMARESCDKMRIISLYYACTCDVTCCIGLPGKALSQAAQAAGVSAVQQLLHYPVRRCTVRNLGYTQMHIYIIIHIWLYMVPHMTRWCLSYGYVQGRACCRPALAHACGAIRSPPGLPHLLGLHHAAVHGVRHRVLGPGRKEAHRLQALPGLVHKGLRQHARGACVWHKPRQCAT